MRREVENDSSSESGSEEMGKKDEKEVHKVKNEKKSDNELIPSSRTLPSYFIISVNGRIESAQIEGAQEVYCKYNLVHGPDWTLTHGVEEGVSQISEKDSDGNFIWNFPIELTFKSTNPHGWPQLVLSVYGSDFFGNLVAKGYGSTHVPITHSSISKIVPLFVPESSSFLQKFSARLFGRAPEFIDSKILGQSQGRQVVRVNSSGHAIIKFEIVTKDLRKLGFTTAAQHFCS